MAEVRGITVFKSVAARTNRFFQCCRVPILEMTAGSLPGGHRSRFRECCYWLNRVYAPAAIAVEENT